MMISPRIGVLIEIHQDVLNLSLLGRVHDHDYGRRRLSISSLWVDVLIASESIWYATLTVVGVKCLGMWACPLLLSSTCMLLVRCKASCSSGWGLSLWYPLLLLLIWGMLLLLVLMRSWREVVVCCILQMLLIALMMIAVSMTACLRSVLDVLFDELLAQSVEVNVLLGCYLQIDLLVPSDMMRSLMLSLKLISNLEEIIISNLLSPSIRSLFHLSVAHWLLSSRLLLLIICCRDAFFVFLWSNRGLPLLIRGLLRTTSTSSNRHLWCTSTTISAAVASQMPLIMWLSSVVWP